MAEAVESLELCPLVLVWCDNGVPDGLEEDFGEAVPAADRPSSEPDSSSRVSRRRSSDRAAEDLDRLCVLFQVKEERVSK